MEKHTGFYFKKISERLERRANESGRKKREITYAQGKILWYLHRHEDEKVTLRDLERFFDCSHATVSGLVARLAEKGYVALERDERDKRAKIVTLTEKEKECFRGMQKRHTELEEILLAGFEKEEREQFLHYLDRVYKNLTTSLTTEKE